MNVIQWHHFKQSPINKTRDKYCPLLFMHRNKIGLLTPLATINKRGDLNKVRRGGEKSKNY